jgi:DNA polymerase III psi subunit
MSANNLRDWTVMVYFSADNDLQDEAFNNLSQMVEVGGNDNVHVLAQIYSRKEIPTRRYFMRGPNDTEATDVEGATRVGSVTDLLKFVDWASSGEHRAKNYLIVLWGHANGIFDDEEDVGTAKAKLEGAKAGELRELSDRSTSAPAGPDNALTSFELKQAFERIEQMLDQKVAILGMDACLMSMAEIATQVGGSVRLMVASEEAIPDKSWPYNRILQRLVEAAQVGPVQPEELAKLIVDEYISCYQASEDPVTLSACRLEKIDDLASGLDELGRALTDLMKDETLRRAVSKARRETQMFLFREYVDLFDFCERLLETLKDKRFQALTSYGAATRAAEGIMDVIGRNGGKASDFVLHSGSTSGEGGILKRAHGVSIYFPPLPATYADLDLSRHTHWNNFVHEYMNKVFRTVEVSETKKRERPEPGASLEQPAESASPAKASPQIVAASSLDQPSRNGTEDQLAENGTKARLLLPKGTLVRDLLGEFQEVLTDQAFLMIDEPAEIKVPEGTVLNIPKKGNVKASSGTSTKASTGTSTKASTGTSTKVNETEVDGSLFLGWLDVPKCILNKAFSGGQTRKLRNGTRIFPPTIAKGNADKTVEPIIVINEVKFVVDEPEIYEEKPALKGRAHANY